MKAVGSLLTLAGETLSAIGRMIERPAFNDEAAEEYLSESAVINKVTFDTLQATREHDLHWSGGRNGRMESDGPDAADVLADFEARVEVFEPAHNYSGYYKCACGEATQIFAEDHPTDAQAMFDIWSAAHRGHDPLRRIIAYPLTSAPTPDPAAESPNPGNPPTGLGHPTSECPGCYDFACPGPHPTSPGASPVSQPAAAAVPGEAVGAVESSSGDGADWPLGELLKESGRLLWAYGIGEASEYTMHLAMQLRTAALRISDTE